MKRADMTQEQKQRVNRQQRGASMRYKKKTYDRISFNIRKDGGTGFTKEQLEHTAKVSGLSVSEWITSLIKDNV